MEQVIHTQLIVYNIKEIFFAIGLKGQALVTVITQDWIGW